MLRSKVAGKEGVHHSSYYIAHPRTERVKVTSSTDQVATDIVFTTIST